MSRKTRLRKQDGEGGDGPRGDQFKTTFFFYLSFLNPFVVSGSKSKLVRRSAAEKHHTMSQLINRLFDEKIVNYVAKKADHLLFFLLQRNARMKFCYLARRNTSWLSFDS